jgi:hypothetical protein
VKSPVKVPEKKTVSKKKEEVVKEPEIIIKKQELAESAEPVGSIVSTKKPEDDQEEPRKIFIPKKITLKEIQDLAMHRDIPIQKKSEKTGKMLNKTIEELREDILGK